MVCAMELPRFAVVDLETSGLRTDRHRILQIGLVTVDADGTIHDTWSTFVKLRSPMSRVGPTHVHGITRKSLRGAPRLDGVLTEFSARLGESQFVAHNARFDGEFLVRAARARTSPLDEQHVAPLERRLCTLRMSRRLDPDRTQSHRLGDVCDRYGVTLERPHDALSDALATAAVLPHLLQAHSVTEREQLDPFLDRPTSQRRAWWRAPRRPRAQVSDTSSG